MLYDTGTEPSWREFGKILLTGFAAAIAIALIGWVVREHGVLQPTIDRLPVDRPSVDRASEVETIPACTIPLAISEEWDRIADFLAGK